MFKTKNFLFFLTIGVLFVLIGLFLLSNKKERVQVVPSSSPVPTSTPSATFAKVIRVIDGDTIVIDTGEHIRYIGMNAPELETSECYATEASEINKNLVLGKEIKLVKDISDADKYGRPLRFVYIGDTFVDDYLVKIGAAKVMTVPPDIEFKDQFLSEQSYARRSNLGLWGKCR